MESDSPASEMLSIIPEDSAEWQAESDPQTPATVNLGKVLKSGETVPESTSSISTRRSSLRSPKDFSYAQFEGLAERVSERVDKQNCSCACQVF